MIIDTLAARGGFECARPILRAVEGQPTLRVFFMPVAARNRRIRPEQQIPAPVAQVVASQIQSLVEGGLAPEVIAEHVVAAIRQERFYVMPSPGSIG